MHQQQHLRNHCPHHSTFDMIDPILQQTRNFHSAWPDAGRLCNVCSPLIEGTVLQHSANILSTSTLAVLAALYNLHTAKMYPFHVQKVQFLTEKDYSHRRTICVLDAIS
ncbi:hypothetical protein TNIN_111181 [Trichonephila inaurata madagascariensis]|uniref:Uncharacterized protein n=1 Tax=Trichonephila inaurata madagascariensis TaxID=2747483 RepID=A0A8X6MB17_9ARAC|nr:hypothetical protein TNIN_111181 [Trichonephila inaurata madagascariensis]